MGAASGSAGVGAGGSGANGAARVWGRRLVTLLAWLVTLPVVVIVVGALFPPFRLIAVIGCLFESFFTVHIFLAGLVGVALADWALRLGGRHGAAERRADFLDRASSRRRAWAARHARSNAALRHGGRQEPVPRYLSPGNGGQRGERFVAGRCKRFAVSHGDEHDAASGSLRAGGDDSWRRILGRPAQRRAQLGSLVCGARLHRFRR